MIDELPNPLKEELDRLTAQLVEDYNKFEIFKKVLKNAINYYGDEEGLDLLYELTRSSYHKISQEEYEIVMKELGGI